MRPEDIPAADVMTTALRCCLPDDTLEQALTVMKTARVRRLPVVDAQGHLRGMLSMNDVVRVVGRRGSPPASGVVEALAAICAPRAVAIAET
jgi:CBS domain-containing protein